MMHQLLFVNVKLRYHETKVVYKSFPTVFVPIKILQFDAELFLWAEIHLCACIMWSNDFPTT